MTPAPRLYAITDSDLLPGPVLMERVEAALAGGCGWVQYRNKTHESVDSRSLRLHQAHQLLALCRRYAAKLIINDDVSLAAEVGADGVHLGQQDESPRNARRRLGGDAIIGVTCHADLGLALAAKDAGASYVAFGRFFTSQTKPGAPAAPLDVLAQAKRALGLPVVAIGGINLANAPEVLTAGADTLAVCGGLFDCADPTERARAFLHL